MSVRPRIGITVSTRSGWRIFPLMALNLWLAGGRAVRWQVGRDIDIDWVDGVIIGGGDDISPTLYGGKVMAEARLDPDRDALERHVLRGAFERGLPVLGVCRGAQMLNVVQGGTLDQDAYRSFNAPNRRTILPLKTVDVLPETHLADIAGTRAMKVNALHSQAVDSLGRGLRVAARDRYGMVQAVERVDDPFAVGVQWHPEHLFYARRQRRLFAALVAAARARRAQAGQIAAVGRRMEPAPSGPRLSS